MVQVRITADLDGHEPEPRVVPVGGHNGIQERQSQHLGGGGGGGNEKINKGNTQPRV